MLMKDSGQEIEGGTTSQIAIEHAGAIASQVQMTGHAVGTQDVIPTTADTPVPKTPELTKVGAEVVGEDLSHIVGSTFGDLTTGGSATRVTKSVRFLNTLMGKLLRKKKPDEEVVTK